MSTIKVNNLQNASGGSNSTPEEIQQGRSKAWVNFNGSNTVAIRNDYNVSSITDTGTGAYKVNMSNAMANTNYAVTANSSHLSGVYLAFPSLRDRDQQTRSTTQFHIDCLNNGGSFTDGHELHISVFGD